MALIACENLSLGYEGNIGVEGLTFQVHSGDYLYVVGENGSGKSTLVKTLLGLIPRMGGKITLGEGLKQSEIGYLPQQTVVQQDFPASVREIVLSGCLNRLGARPFYGEKEKRVASESMEKLGIAPLAKRCYRELSGGQQQRTLLARALCATQKLLILDEPVTGLDPNAAVEMYEWVSRLNREEGITLVMISHDIPAAMSYASHILHMGPRRPLFFGETAAYRESDIGKAFGRMERGQRHGRDH